VLRTKYIIDPYTYTEIENKEIEYIVCRFPSYDTPVNIYLVMMCMIISEKLTCHAVHHYQ